MKLNPDGKDNYVYMETRGRGQLMGVTMGVLQNANGWWGEGDEMIFIDDESKPEIVGPDRKITSCGGWNFGGREGAVPFATLCTARRSSSIPERTGGRIAVPLARRQPRDLQTLSETHDGARPRQRSFRQLLFGGLLVSGRGPSPIFRRCRRSRSGFHRSEPRDPWPGERSL